MLTTHKHASFLMVSLTDNDYQYQLICLGNSTNKQLAIGVDKPLVSFGKSHWAFDQLLKYPYLFRIIN